MVGRLDPRAGRSGCRGRRDLLQQRRLSRHVRPRHDRRRRRAARTWDGSGRARTGSRRPWATVAITLEGPNTRGHRQRRELPVGQGRRGRGAGLRRYVGDVAWGGNWFFLVQDHGETLERGQRRAADRSDLAHPPGLERRGHPRGRTAARSTTSSSSGRRPARTPTARISCCAPGKAYDRSPCGTGTSAKLACLVADGKLGRGTGLAAGEHHRQHLRRLGADRRGPGPAADPRDGLRQCRVDPDRRPGRSLRDGHPAMSMTESPSRGSAVS